jgi:hypothetical protein
MTVFIYVFLQVCTLLSHCELFSLSCETLPRPSSTIADEQAKFTHRIALWSSTKKRLVLHRTTSCRIDSEQPIHV